MKVGLTGLTGRMGNAILKHLSELNSDQYQIAALLSNPGSTKANTNKTNYKDITTDNIEKFVQSVDAIIDYSVTNVTLELTKLCAKYNRMLVSGTTGFNDDELLEIKKNTQEFPMILSFNTSTMVNIMFAVSQMISKLTTTQYDAEVVESHHRNKIDSPSGTAIKLGEALAAGRNQSLEDVMTMRTQGKIGQRPEGEIGFSVIRGGGIIGEHEAIFVNDYEKLSVKHTSFSREIYIQGALTALAWLKKKNQKGLFDMNDVLDLHSLFYNQLA